MKDKTSYKTQNWICNVLKGKCYKRRVLRNDNWLSKYVLYTHCTCNSIFTSSNLILILFQMMSFCGRSHSLKTRTFSFIFFLYSFFLYLIFQRIHFERKLALERLELIATRYYIGCQIGIYWWLLKYYYREMKMLDQRNSK